jgi:hypothetical protein
MSTSRTLKTHIGEDCPVEVWWDYQPYERMTLEYPGAAEAATLEMVHVDGQDIMECLNEVTLEQLREKCLEDEHER